MNINLEKCEEMAICNYVVFSQTKESGEFSRSKCYTSFSEAFNDLNERKAELKKLLTTLDRLVLSYDEEGMFAQLRDGRSCDDGVSTYYVSLETFEGYLKERMRAWLTNRILSAVENNHDKPRPFIVEFKCYSGGTFSRDYLQNVLGGTETVFSDWAKTYLKLDATSFEKIVDEVAKEFYKDLEIGLYYRVQYLGHSFRPKGTISILYQDENALDTKECKAYGGKGKNNQTALNPPVDLPF